MPMDDAAADVERLFPGEAPMLHRLRATPWATTSLGAPGAWPAARVAALRIAAASAQPMLVWCGPEPIQLHNDAAAAALGAPADAGFGRAARETWPECWDALGPRFEAAARGAASAWPQRLVVERDGRRVETHWTFSCSPLADDAGVLCTLSERTDAVRAQQRMAALAALAQATADPADADQACRRGAAALAAHADALPFALVYRLDADGRRAHLAGAAGVEPGAPAAPTLMAIDEPPAAWHDGPERGVVLPIGCGAEPAGFVVAGLHPLRPFDAAQRAFLDLVAAQLSGALARAGAPDGLRGDGGPAWVRDTESATLDPLPSPPSPPAASPRPTLLVVDDNPDMRLHLRRLLEPDYDVIVAADGEQALAAVAAHEPELVLSDTLMPRLDGLGLLKALRAHPASAALPVILLAPHGGGDDRIAAIEAGADDHVTKPFSARELLARVAGAIAIARVRREALQRERERRAETFGVLEAMTDAFIAVDADWRVTFVNAATERFLGLPRDAIAGRDHWELFPDARGTDAERECRRAMRERVAVTVEQASARLGRWFEVGAFPIRRGGLALFGRDITTRKQAEEALKRADRRKDEFLATLAHELRNPLAPIRSALQLLRRSPEADAAPLHAMMERQVDHIVRLVDDLMEVARITEGKIELRRGPVALGDVIARAVETSRTLIDGAGHTLALDLPEPPPHLHGDPVRLAQVFANLLNNAAKYTEPGGRIVVAARIDGDAVVVSVRDNGVGIGADMLPQVFDLFTQARDAGRHSQGGLGIGLTLVRSLVEMHGGSVEARSDGPFAGSEFVVRLPLAHAAPAPACAPVPRPAPEPAATPGPAPRVLVVDDNIDAAEAVALVLEHLGAPVHVVHDGAAALAAVKELHPGLVLLDLGMAGLDGYDVARWIRERPAFADVRIVALTGWGDAAERARTLGAGFDGHLVKPVDIDALQSLLVR